MSQDINNELVLLERENKLLLYQNKIQKEHFSKQLNEYIFNDIQETLKPKKQNFLKRILYKIFTLF